MGNKQKLDLSKAGLEKCIQLLGGLTELYEKQIAESSSSSSAEAGGSSGGGGGGGERKKQRKHTSRGSSGDKTHLVDPVVGAYLLSFIRDVMVPLIGNTDNFDESPGDWSTNPEWESLLASYHPETQVNPLQMLEGRSKRLGPEDSVALFRKRAGTKRQKNEVADRVAIAISTGGGSGDGPDRFLGVNTFNLDSVYHCMNKQHRLPFLEHDSLLFPIFIRGKGCTEYVSTLGPNTPYSGITQLPLSLMVALAVDGMRGYTKSNIVSYIGNACLKNLEYTTEAFYFRAVRTALKLLSTNNNGGGDDWTRANYSIEDYCDFMWDFTANLVCKLYERRGGPSASETPLVFKKFEFWTAAAIDKWDEVRKERGRNAVSRMVKSGGKTEREARAEVRNKQILARVGKMMYDENAVGKPEEFMPMLLDSMTAFMVRIDGNFISGKRKGGPALGQLRPPKKRASRKLVAPPPVVPSEDECSQFSDSSAAEDFNEF
jgi:hypothetical protein